MRCRALRRHQECVAKARHKHILMYRWGWPWIRIIWRNGIAHEHAPRSSKKPWKPLRKLVMNEPGWWIRERMIRPMRITANRQLRLIEKGRDPDQFQWPDGKKPHEYYW